jgi:trimethylamine--corrinoid protein Co-methyltransferase
MENTMADTIRPGIKLISEKIIAQVFDEACTILETSGVFVECDEAVEILTSSGATLRQGRVCIPSQLVEQSLSTVPKSITLFDRNGQEQAHLHGDRVHFVPGSAALLIYSHDRGDEMIPSPEECRDFICLSDALQHYPIISTALVPGGIPEILGDRYRLYLALCYSSKPVVTGTFHRDSFPTMKEMLLAVRGDEDTLTKKPLAIFDCCPSPPLKWSDLTCMDLIRCARSMIPAELVSMPLAGATAPVTLLGAVTQQCAENLSGIVIHQLSRKGAPIIYGGSPAMFEMRKGTTPMGAIETMMINVASNQVGKYLGLPTHAYMGLSDAKIPDAQGGIESGMGALLAGLAGINVVSGPGMLNFETCQSMEKLVLDNEICGMVHRLLGGIEKRGEPICSDLFTAITEHTHFLTHRHTSEWFRRETCFPGAVIDRDDLEGWRKKGKPSLMSRAQQVITGIMEKKEKSFLDSARMDQLDDIMRREFETQEGVPPVLR